MVVLLRLLNGRSIRKPPARGFHNSKGLTCEQRGTTALPGEPPSPPHTPSFEPTFTAQPTPIDAAWHEGAKVCSDLIRDVVARLRDSPEWRLEVRDETDEPLHLFQLTAETFKKE